MSCIDVFFANKATQGPGYHSIAFKIKRTTTIPIGKALDELITKTTSPGFHFPQPSNRVVVTCNGYLRENDLPSDLPKFCSYVIVFPRGYNKELVTNALLHLTKSSSSGRRVDRKKWLTRMKSSQLLRTRITKRITNNTQPRASLTKKTRIAKLKKGALATQKKAKSFLMSKVGV
mmetsp:Transcript_24205/g.26881  ORF Transcript_24205/g.26881 Transcript_24205/m.26881 type:complete len:175 (-) Transcript_24205:100-624(-)